jgi:CubicO group peptidase (beta-lactamase class C family)
MLLAHQSSLNDNDQLIDGWFSLMMGFTSILNYPEYPYPRIKEYIVPNGSLYKKSIWMDKPPGEVTQYTNVGFMLLEHLFNCISGQPLEEYCRYNIFNPLNMMNTSFQLSYFDQKQIAIPYARISLLKIPLPHFQLAHASSNLRTTCEDLSHFLIAHMNGGVYNGVRILNESTISLMHSVQYPNSHFGLGWDAINQGHGGSWLGCDSNMWIRNSNSTGLIFFMNKMVNTNIKSVFFAYKKITEELFLKANEF